MATRLGIVTATTNLDRTYPWIASWRDHAAVSPHVLIVENGGEGPYLGTVPAFRKGVDVLLADPDAADIEVIACLHDDVEITERGWDQRVLRLFAEHPACGLAGFGGALRLGADGLYDQPYDPMLLARGSFRSNLRDAEAHGIRSLVSERVVCLDGFSQIGRRAFWLGQGLTPNLANARDPEKYGGLRQWDRPWSHLEDLGVIHHFYDGLLGCLARRYGWETWYCPVACIHYGGQTAVGDTGYQDWAKTQVAGGDHGFWEAAHKTGYEAFRDVLPLRL